MKINLLLISVFLSITYAKSQTNTPTVIASDGGFSQNAQGSIAWTIGEPVGDTYISATNITTMGFMQPELEVVTFIKSQGNQNGPFVFPNPVKDELKINFSGLEPGKYSIRLTDALGKLIYNSDETVNENSKYHIIKLNEVAAANYFLIISNSTFNSTIKINKID